MKKIYAHYLSKFTNPFKSAVLLIGAICLTSVVVSAQTACLDPGGGKYDRSMGNPTARSTTIYPGAVPIGHTGQQKGTVGYLYNYADASLVYPANTVTINPLLNGITGSVALRFELLSLVAPQAKIEIFKGTSVSGSPVIILTEANRTAYEGISVAYNGAVTLRFTSPTPASGNFNFEIRYMTGDQLLTSSFNHKVAVWTEFIQPNSYTFIDDFTLGTANSLPINIGHFDASRTFVGSEIAHCAIHDRKQIGVTANTYPGEINFQVQTDKSNFDRLGSTWNVQQLKMARVAWIIANAPKTTRGEMDNVRNAIWTTMGADYASNYGGLHGQAMTAVPTVPSSSPSAPTLSMSVSAPTVVSGKPATFTLNVTGGTAPLNVKLDIPAGVTINSVTGAAYSAGNLTITSLPASVQITATSATAQSATLKAIFGSVTNFYNPDNFNYYVPCEKAGNDPFQDFVGYSLIEQMFPTATASATWTAATALACTDGYYYVENINGTTSLYRYNLGGTTLRTLITSVTGDYNAMGYSVIDNFLWGYDRTTNQVFKLGADGSELFTIPNMPTPTTSTSRSVGTVDLNGYLYLYEPNATEYITIDINPGRSTYLQIVDPTNSYIAKTGAPWGTTTTDRNISDWAYNPTTGMIHAIINGAGSNALLLSQLNPVTGISTLSTTPISGTNFTTGTNTVFDSQFFDASGNLIVFSSYWFSIDLASNTATQLWDKASPLLTSDGAACLSINSPTAFDCSDLYYQVEGDKLYSLDETGARTTIATLSGNLNAIGYSTVDNALWGFDNTIAQIFRLGANGVIQRFAISNMPAATQPDGFSLGTVATNGYLFLYEKNGLNYITIDIDPARPDTYLKLVDPTASFTLKTAAPWGTTLIGGARGISDWAYNPVDHLIYALIDGSAANSYQILQVNPTTGATTLLAGQVTGGGLQTSSQNFGSSFIDSEGNFMVFGNTTGHLYYVSISAKTAVQISTTATPSASNDGAFCPLNTYTPLPVALISFEAVSENATVRLNWSTALEINSSGFDIERSNNAKNWSKLSFVPTHTPDGNSKTRLSYHFDDTAPLNGKNYYRLKLLDIDGKYTYSRIKSATVGGNGLSVYPNPVTDGLLTIDSGAEIITSAEVYNMAGMKVLDKKQMSGKVLNIGGLFPGIYLLKTTDAQGEANVKTFSVR